MIDLVYIAISTAHISLRRPVIIPELYIVPLSQQNYNGSYCFLPLFVNTVFQNRILTDLLTNNTPIVITLMFGCLLVSRVCMTSTLAVTLLFCNNHISISYRLWHNHRLRVSYRTFHSPYLCLTPPFWYAIFDISELEGWGHNVEETVWDIFYPFKNKLLVWRGRIKLASRGYSMSIHCTVHSIPMQNNATVLNDVTELRTIAICDTDLYRTFWLSRKGQTANLDQDCWLV